MSESLTTTRRTLLVGALATGAGLAFADLLVAKTPEAFAKNSSVPPSTEEGVQYGFWIDTRRCVGCRECVKACKKYNETPDDIEPRRKVVSYVSDAGEKVHVSTACMHCVEPSCANVCPAGAIEKRADGIVFVNKERCMGCKYCYQACPFEVPQYTHAGMDKCDCCLENGIAPGEDPRCVQACGRSALRYGPVERLRSLAGEKVQFISAPTRPSCLIS